MDKKNKDILKKGLLETNTDFTSNLMGQINAEERALSSVLSKDGALETSVDFTDSLMSKLEGKVPAKPYKSVISKPAWIGIAAIFSVVILLALLTSGQESISIKYDLRVEELTNNFAAFFNNSPFVTYTSLGVLILTLGLLFEQQLRKRA